MAGRSVGARAPVLAVALLAWSGEPARCQSRDLVDPPTRIAEGRPGRFAVPIVAAGHRWTYHVHIPNSYREREPLPLVVVLHGSGGSGRTYLDDAGWARLAEREGFLVVAPDGLPARPDRPANFLNNPRLWNSGQHPPGRARSRVDDLAFFDALLADLATRWRVDPRRVYVAGHSNGGAMAFRLAAERADRIAAAASVAGLCYLDDPRPTRPIPTLLLAGMADPILPFKGGVSVLPWEVRTTPPVEENVRRWARALGLDDRPAVDLREAGLRVQRFGPDAESPVFQAVYLPGQGHRWPGSDVPRLGPAMLGPARDDLDATLYLWTFFRGRVLPDPDDDPVPMPTGRVGTRRPRGVVETRARYRPLGGWRRTRPRDPDVDLWDGPLARPR